MEPTAPEIKIVPLRLNGKVSVQINTLIFYRNLHL